MRATAAALAAAAALTPPAAAADPAPGESAPIASAAQADLAERLGKPAALLAKKVTASGGWAFLYASIHDPGSDKIDWHGTPFAEDAENGAMSSVYAGLLHEDGSAWRVVERAIGPTDLAWDRWASQTGAPPSIFQTGDS